VLCSVLLEPSAYGASPWMQPGGRAKARESRARGAKGGRAQMQFSPTAPARTFWLEFP